jgi:hypothetical protein
MVGLHYSIEIVAEFVGGFALTSGIIIDKIKSLFGDGVE